MEEQKHDDVNTEAPTFRYVFFRNSRDKRGGGRLRTKTQPQKKTYRSP